MAQEKRRRRRGGKRVGGGVGEEDGRRRMGGGGEALGRDATFPWSRALTHPSRCNRMRNRVIRGRDITGVMPLIEWRPS